VTVQGVAHYHSHPTPSTSILIPVQPNDPMTVRTNVLPLDLATVTLTEAQWSTIRTALLCLACDCRVAGKGSDADYYLKAYNDLKAAMGME